MRDLLVVTPSRGRPERLKVMLDAAMSLSEAQTDIAVGIDGDDPARAGYEALEPPRGTLFWYRPRDTVAGWTNWLARSSMHSYRALMSMSDDHLPRTQGWDRLLLEAIDRIGGTGFAYGDDLLQGKNMPTACLVTADIVQALGWKAEPSMRHYQIDKVWLELGKRAGCIAYVPGVVIEHVHPGAGHQVWDETYASEAALDGQDTGAWNRWLAERADADAAKITALIARKDKEAPVGY